MRVLYSFPHEMARAGIGTTAYEQASGVARRGATVRVRSSRAGARPLPQGSRTTLSRGRLHLPQRAVGVGRARAWHDRMVAREVRRHPEHFDIVHCWPSGALETLRAAAAAGVPTVLERPSAYTRQVFAISRDECLRLGLDLDRSHYAAFDERRLAREEEEFHLATALLCPSDFVVRTFLDAGYPADRLLRHQYGYDPERFRPPAPGEARSRDGLVALFVGEAYPLKGLHHALRAWIDSGAGERGRLLVCGRILPSYGEALRDLLDHPSVEVRGFVDDVAALMRGADVLVHPSLAEGSALVVYEARASGCVPLVSDAAGAEGTHGADCLVHPAGDVATLTEHLAALVSDRDRLECLRARSLERARHLTWDDAAARLLDAYAEAAR